MEINNNNTQNSGLGSGGNSTIEHIATSVLVPYARNSRTHSDEQVAQIMASIREFGFCNPILIDAENGVIAGHGRLVAAQRLQMETVPCIRLGHLTETQRRAYVIADNKIALNSGWNDELLSLELMELEAADFNIEQLGFEIDELDTLRSLESSNEDKEKSGADAEPQFDRLDELQRQWKTKSGQLWTLGEHRLLCGDSTKAEDVQRLMAGAKADLCFTSPPYGQQRAYTKESDCSDWDKLMQGVFANLPMSDAGQVLVNLGPIHRDGEWLPYWDQWIEWMRTHGWKRFGLYIWDKQNAIPGDHCGRCAPAHEFIFHFNHIAIKPVKFIQKKPESITMGSGRTLRHADGIAKATCSPESSLQTHKIPDSVWRMTTAKTAGKVETNHPAVYPVQLPAFGMQCWPGVVFEPFCGSGTTIIAAEQLGRICYAMEISPAYVAVILQRYQDATGNTPVLVHDG